ncbi:hypothetical protein J4460_05450 [Candidatus Woesearchaeota archaeon]|nr:MAG: hypothetical protein QS99_C0015G0003 [archaeon GW2011_AR4]MBS3130091.1 hypothetical protein [Candidatus Woesearchaeota archaeon]HIH38708.1 hypothetical protein [Candidatus Woesearchaeota archaeon]HIH49310.1 hypothetical protein [Candidatus Woesearchaeota archaeon]HIJ03650.1 hypothetical protein [Candidatus Woesearchaeota archaeon]
MGNYLFLLNGVSNFAVALGIGILLYLYQKKVSQQVIRATYGLIIIHSIFAALNFSWLYQVSMPGPEFVAISGILLALQATYFAFALSVLTPTPGYPYLLALLLGFAFPTQFWAILGLGTGVAGACIFAYLITHHQKNIRIVGFAGITYSILIIIFHGISLLGLPYTTMPWIIPNLALIWMIATLTINHNALKEQTAQEFFQKKEVSMGLLALKYLIFIFTLSTFIFIGVASLHQIGYLMAAQMDGCQAGRAIIYDLSNLPRIEVGCDVSAFFALGGLLVPLLFCILLYAIGTEFMMFISRLILGFSLLVSSSDLSSSENIVIVLMIIALGLVFSGIFKLSNYFFRQTYVPRRLFERYMGNIEPDKCLFIHDGFVVKSVYDLAFAFAHMDHETYAYHVTKEKNDFVSWVRDVIQDNFLAYDLLAVKNKDEAHDLVLKRLAAVPHP